MILSIGDDHRLRTALAHAERLNVHALIAHAYAAETQNAARRVVIDRFGPFMFGLVAFFLGEAAFVGAVGKTHVLQFAFAALVAYGAIERLVGWRESEHVLAGMRNLYVAVANNRA